MSEYDNKMNKIMVTIIAVIVVFSIFYIAVSYSKCDGKLVQGLFGLECIQEQSK